MTSPSPGTLPDCEFTDFFSGGGGSATGLVQSGYRLKVAINHDPVAIRTHQANHPSAAHLCADTTTLDMRRLPRTRVAWGSPICTENSPCGGNTGTRSPRTDGQLPIGELGHRPQPGFERTRATFGDILRATEVHRYDVVLIENVPDVIWRWELLDWWCLGMVHLGYRLQVVSANSAHLSGPHFQAAPQDRNRAYLAFTRTHLPAPDLTIRPDAWCPRCQTEVRAIQRFKPGAPRILGQPAGKHGPQYTYLCPKLHAEVTPRTRGIGEVIDHTDRGAPLAAQNLSPATHTRIRAAWTAARAEATQTSEPIRPYIITLRRNVAPHPVTEPIATLAAQGNHHYLLTPPTGEISDRLGECGYRMLTVHERARAQGFPADYQLTGTVAKQVLHIGNAVSVNAARWLGDRTAPVLT